MQNNGLSRIYFKDILTQINKKDIRSVATWCRKNNVEIFQDSAGKFVIEAEFDYAYNRPIIERYKKKYGEDWVQVYDRMIEHAEYIKDSLLYKRPPRSDST